MAKAVSKIDVYTIVTEKIIAALEGGTSPWECPWASSSLLPANFTTGKEYRGINILLLWVEALDQGFKSSQWLTFNQAKKVGGVVQKGSKSSLVTFFSFVKKENDEGEDKVIPMLRYYRVFNTEQVGNLAEEVVNDNARLQNVEEALLSIPVEIQHGGNRACYHPKDDTVTVPAFSSFKGEHAYYATVFHELIHWTGHESRMNRDLTGRFGGEAYAMEELVAELGAAFACARLGLPYQTQHADYINTWVKALKADKYAIFTAARHASQACDFLLSVPEEDQEDIRECA